MKIEIEFKKALCDMKNAKDRYDILELIKVDEYSIDNGFLHVRGKKVNVYYSLANIKQFEIKKQ